MSESKRESIVAAAEKLFLEKGFHQTSAGDLAHAASCSQATFYRHYANKAEILRKIVQPRLVALGMAIAEQRVPNTDPIDDLLEAIVRGFSFLVEDPLLASLYQERAISFELQEEFDRIATLVDTFFLSLFEKTQREHNFSVEDPAAVVALFRCTVDGFMMFESRRPDALSQQRFLQALKLVLRSAIHYHAGGLDQSADQ